MIAEFAEGVLAVDPKTGAGIMWCKTERTCPTCRRAAMQLTLLDARTTCPECRANPYVKVTGLGEVLVEKLSTFLADNHEAAELCAAVLELAPGQSLVWGGGAAPEVTIARLS